jgi:hypothetical protein
MLMGPASVPLRHRKQASSLDGDGPGVSFSGCDAVCAAGHACDAMVEESWHIVDEGILMRK